MQNKKVRLSGEERRSQIIDAALRIFAEKGFSGSRIKEIAELAGISETLIYQHFDTKEDLYRAALQALFSGHPVEPQVEAKMIDKDDAGVFGTIALHLIHHSRHDPKIIRLALFSALDGLHFKEITHGGNGVGPTLQELLEGYIQQRIDDGAFRRVKAPIAARLFLETVYMYALDQHAAVSGPPLSYSDDEVIETLVDLFLNGLKP